MSYQWECPEASHWALDLLRLNDPFQNIKQDAMAWLTYGENHLCTFPEYPQGMFTLRVVSMVRGRPTLHESLAEGKTHHVHAFNDRKRPVEGQERKLNAFLVDLRIASMGLHLADEERRNNSDGVRYLIFDAMKPEVRLFCRQLKIK